ncbi:MAG: sodium:proline symporter [Acidobacteria bacterium]|nr:MAG: sodium:proline symporter [Acidobacteriota bacterium]
MTASDTGAVLIIALFMLIPLAMGAVAGRKSIPTTEDFFVQGRGMGSVAVFFTVAATWWSSFAFLGSNASFYLQGPLFWTALAWNILFGLLYYVVGKRVWFLGKRWNFITPKDFFTNRYGSVAVGNLVAVIMLVFTLPYLQIQLSGGAYLIEVASGGLIPFAWAALIFYVVIIIYVWSGGLRAVAWTDIFYGVLLFFGMVVAGLLVANELGGTVAMFDQLAEARPENLVLADGAWMTWIAMFLVTPIGAFMGPQLWTRMYAVKSGRLFDLMPFLLGLAAVSYFGSMLVGNSGVLLEPDVAEPDKILPIMLYKYAPYVLASFLVACGAAAAMSTANSQIHSMSSVYTLDFHKTYINPRMSERQLVWVGRWTILVLSAIAYVMALYVPGLLVTVGLVALAGTAQVIVPTAGALFWRRSTAAGALAGLLVGVGTLVLFTFVPAATPPPFDAGGGGLLSLILNLVVFVVVSLTTTPRDETLLTRHDEDRALFDAEDFDAVAEPARPTGPADGTRLADGTTGRDVR